MNDILTEADDTFERLARPFPSSAISWRVGSTNGDKTKGMALAYIDARDVMDRLDEVVGPNNWQDTYSHASKDGYVCQIGIRIEGEWVWKSDAAGETDYEAQKGAASDAFKRAAVRWGIGRYLYNLGSPWVAIEQAGRSFKIKQDEYDRLESIHDKAIEEVEWGHRSARNAYRVVLATLRHFAITDEMVGDFMKANQGSIAQLPVAMRLHLTQEAERLQEHYRNVAANPGVRNLMAG